MVILLRLQFIVTLFMMATIPGSAASICILFNASEGGGFNCIHATMQLNDNQF